MCVPCNATRYLCYQQLISTTIFKSNQTNKTFKFCHRVNCKSSFVIYLLECYICNIQYVSKSETPFKIWLNNHRKDVQNPNATPGCKHFNWHDHDIIGIIEQLRNFCTTSTETLKERLKQWENFWIRKLVKISSEKMTVIIKAVKSSIKMVLAIISSCYQITI